MQTGPQPYAEFYLRPGDQDVYGVNWASVFANRWTPNVAVTAVQAIRPAIGNGYQYVVTTAGTTAGAEPTWPTTIGQTVTDGSVVWTCAAIDTTSLEDTVASVSWTVPTGASVSGQSLVGQIAKARVIIASNVTAPITLDVLCVATTATGLNRTAKFRFFIR